MTKWKTVRVFISSTFRDMHSERDWLVKRVFPELRERLLAHKLHLVDIDLRWGITEEQSNNDKVLDLCLDEIDKSRPFFVGILGERYGWVPRTLDINPISKRGWIQSHTGKSVTELEILYGVLDDPKMRVFSFFYFRNPGFTLCVPETKRADVMAEDPESAIKLADLKERIRRAGLPVTPMENYPCAYQGLRINLFLARQELHESFQRDLHNVADDGIVEPDNYASLSDDLRAFVDRNGTIQLRGLEAFGTRVLEDLWAGIKARFDLSAPPVVCLRDQNPLIEERAYHDQFFEQRTRTFVGRRKYLNQLLHLAKHENTLPILVVAPSGAGKSALLAKFCDEYQHRHPDDFLLAHYVGASPRSTNLREMLRRLCEEMRARFKFTRTVTEKGTGQKEVPIETPFALNELVLTFQEFVGRIPADHHTVIVIDALDQLDDADNAHTLYWLPRTWLSHVRCIISCIANLESPDQPVLKAFADRKCCTIHLNEFTVKEQFAIVTELPSISAKSLSPHQIRLLLDNPAARNPLFLLVALEELRGFGSYEQLEARIQGFQRFSNECDPLSAIFEQVLIRLESEFGVSNVRSTLSWLACSRSGLSETELLELLQSVNTSESISDLYPILRQLRPHLQQRGDRIDFHHTTLKIAAARRYLFDDTTQKIRHRELSNYFRAKGYENSHAITDLPYHQTKGELWDDAYATMSDFYYLRQRCDLEDSGIYAFLHNLGELLRRWPFPARTASERQKSILSVLNEIVPLHHHEWKEDANRVFQQMYPWLAWWGRTNPRDATHCEILDYVETVQNEWNGLALPWLRQTTCPAHGLERARLPHDHVSRAFFTDEESSILTIGRGTVLWDNLSLVPLPSLVSDKSTHRVFLYSLRAGIFRFDTAAAVSQSGLLALASGVKSRKLESNSGCQVSIYELRTGSLLREQTYPAPVLHVAWSPDDRFLAVTCVDGRAQIWIDDGRELYAELLTAHEYGGHWDDIEYPVPGDDFPTRPTFSNDSTYVAVGRDETCWIWNVSTKTSIVRLEDPKEAAYVKGTRWLRNRTVSATSISKDGTCLATGMWDGTVRIWDVSTQKACELLEGPSRFVTDLCWLSGGRRLIACYAYGDCFLWDLDKPSEGVQAVRCGSTVTTSTSSSDGKRVLVTEEDGACYVCDADGPVRSYWNGYVPTREVDQLRFHPVTWTVHGRFAAAGIKSGLCLIDGRSGQVVHSSSVNGEQITALSYCNRTSQLYAATNEGNLVILNPELEVVAENHILDGSIHFLQLASDGRLAIASNLTGNVAVWHSDSHKIWDPAPDRHGGGTWKVSDHGDTMAYMGCVESRENSPSSFVTRLWDMTCPDARLTNEAECPDKRTVLCASFGVSGRRLWMGGGDTPFVRVLSREDSAYTGIYDGTSNEPPVICLSVDPTEQFVAFICEREPVIRICAALERRQFCEISHVHAGLLDTLCWSPTSPILASGGRDGVSLWSTDGTKIAATVAKGIRSPLVWSAHGTDLAFIDGRGEPCAVHLECIV